MKPATVRKIISRIPYVILAFTIGAALTAAAVDKVKEKIHHNVSADTQPAPKVSVDEKPLQREGKFGVSFSPIVKKVSQSVVRLDTTTKAKNASFSNGGAGGPMMDDPFLRRFFGEEFDGSMRQGRRQFRMPSQHGVGSGVIVTKDGYILTNNHVVDGADEVKVTMQDGKEFNGKVVGKDPKTDIAVVKVSAKDLPAISIANSDKAEVGDLVLAIGNPFGIGQTVTTGIVSAMGRASLGLDYEDFIQTDAAINPGNSGGALVDAEGRLLGINTAILSRTGGNQGIGFAIPANLAREIMESLVSDGRVTRGYLGVMIQDVTPSIAKEFKLAENKGALVGDVVPNGPAEKAGLKNGDVVLEFNSKPIQGSRNLKLEVARTKPGEAVPVKILRDGSTKTLDVTVKELKTDATLSRNTRQGDEDDSEALKGVAVTDIDPRTRRDLNLPAKIKGVMVTEVEPGSPAEEAGLRPGAVILEINKKPVASAEEAVKLTERSKDKTTLLRIWNEGSSRYIVVDESNAG